MSRIIKNIINNSLSNIEYKIIVFLNPNNIDIDIINLPYNLYGFSKHQSDLNNKITIVVDKEISGSSAFTPTVILCDFIPLYEQAKNIANIFKIPLINIIKEDQNIKNESMFMVAKKGMASDINLISSDDLAKKMYITNYSLLSNNLSNQIEEEVQNWVLK